MPFPQEMEYRFDILAHGRESIKTGFLGAEYRNKYKNYFIKLMKLQQKRRNYIQRFCRNFMPTF